MILQRSCQCCSISGHGTLNDSYHQNVGECCRASWGVSWPDKCYIAVYSTKSVQFGCHTSPSPVPRQACDQLTWSCYLDLRKIAKLRSSSRAELEMITNAFSSSRLDYENSLCTCMNKSSLHWQQKISYHSDFLLPAHATNWMSGPF